MLEQRPGGGGVFGTSSMTAKRSSENGVDTLGCRIGAGDGTASTPSSPSMPKPIRAADRAAQLPCPVDGLRHLAA